MSKFVLRPNLRLLLSRLFPCALFVRPGIVLVLAMVCLGTASAHADTCTVNVLTDTGAGSGTTGDLRYCLNNLSSGTAASTNTINFSVTGTITATSRLPFISNGVTINGPSIAGGITISTGSFGPPIDVQIAANLNIVLSNLTFANNQNAASGGAIYLVQSEVVTVNNCTFSDNSSPTDAGGAIENNDGTLIVNNSTFAGNSALAGGAIDSILGTTTVTNSTFVGNSAEHGGSISTDQNNTLNVYNSLFVGNSATDAGPAIWNEPDKYYVSIVNSQNNVFYNNLDPGTTTEDGCYNCATGTSTSSNNVNATSNPLTLPLGNYGGLTQTFLPQPGSAAICAGSAVLAADAGLSFDQRGETTGPSWSCSNGSSVDAGAVQSNYIQVTNSADAGSGLSDCTSSGGTTCTLRDAIALADSGSGGGDIDFASSALPTINLGSGLTITGNGVNIIGPGASALTVNGGGTSSNFSVFEILPTSTATLYGLTVSNGNVNGATDPGGGGIFNGGTLTLLSSTVSGNTDNAVYSVDGGGGILNFGTLTLLSSTVSGNTADLAPGGGIASLAGIVTITDSTISDNMSANSGTSVGDSVGGGIFISAGTVTIADSTISGNTAYFGGGILNAGSMVITESTISGNTANGGSATDGISLLIYGGGIANSGALALLSSTISGNSAICNTSECVSGSGGGGIANLDGTGTLILANSIVEGNMAIGNSVTNADIDNSSLTITPPSDPTLLFDIALVNILSIAEGNTSNFDGLFSSTEGTINDVGGNIINTSSSAATVNPGLSALQYNGTGATVQTMIPLPNSPAICAGKTSLVPGSITTDERGFPLTTPGYCTSGQIDSGAVQTNYTGLAFAVQPTNTLVNTAITPAPAVEITETNTSTGATDTVAGVPIPIYYSGGSAEMATPANLAATTASTTIDGKTVNAATYSLTPNTTGSGFTLAIGPSGEGIAVSSSSVLTGPAGNSFDVYGVLADIQLSVSPSPVAAGGSVTITATAVDTNGNIVPNNNDTVTLITWLGPVPVQLTNGVGSISIPAPTAAGGSYMVSGLDETEISVSVLPASFTVTPGALSSVTVTGYPASVIVGVSATGTVVLLDAYSNVLTGTSGTGTVVTSENATPIPVTITNGVGSFSTSFATAASSQSITASFGGISGEQQNITVAPVPGFVVTSTGDADSGVAGNCTPNAAANSAAGSCSLRDAIAAVNAANGGNITFSTMVFGATAGAQTITLGPTYGALTITGSGVNITGPGANLLAVSGNKAVQVFNISNGATVSIFGITIENGLSTTTGGGGIYNNGTLNLSSCMVTGNQQTGNGTGGGIYNDTSGTLTINQCTLSENMASGTSSEGGSIYSSGTLTVTGSTLYGNSVGSTTANVDGFGGGIYSTGTLTIVNSTISGNSASEGSINAATGGGIYLASGTATLANSIVAGNMLHQSTGTANYADIYGNYTDNGGNIASNSPNYSSTINIQLGPLQYNGAGAELETVVPLPGSAAICAGLAENVPLNLTNDERGYPLFPNGGYCTGFLDAGAVQTNYTSVTFNQQPSDTEVNTAMSPSPVAEIVETNTTTGATDAVAGVPLPLYDSNGSAAVVVLNATTAAVTTGGATVNEATYSLTPAAVGTGFTLAAGSTGNGITITSGTLLTVTSNSFLVYGAANNLKVSAPASVTAGTAFTVNITAQDANGTTVENDNDTVSLTVGGTQVGTLTLTNGVGSTTVTLNAAGNVVLTGTDSTPSPAVMGTANIDVLAIPLTASISAANKMYNTSTAATVTCSLPSGVQMGDVVTCSAANATFATRNVGTGITVTATGLTLSGTNAAKYALTSTTATATANISTALLTITAATNSKTYDATINAAALPTVGMAQLQGSDTVTGLAEVYSTDAVGTGKTLNVSAYTVNDGNNGQNYSVTPVANTTGVITAAVLNITANNATKVYGAANPMFTGSVTNQQNGDTFTESFSTLATAVSPVGSYTITPSVTGANLADYTQSVTTGTLSITQATPAISLTPSVSTVMVQNPVTLTATVGSPVSTPTRSVTFLDGSTPLGTVPLTAGVAALTTTSLAMGAHSITAVYSGDSNFVTVTSTATSVLVSDFSLTPVPTSQTIQLGGTANYSFTVSPVGATVFPSGITLSVSGLPAGVTYSFSPSSTIASGSGATNLTLTITTPQQAAMLHQPSRLLPVSLAALLLLPFAGLRRKSRRLSRLCGMLLLLVGGVAGMAVMTGCGSSNGFFAQPQQSYTVTVTGTSGALTHSTTVTLTVE